MMNEKKHRTIASFTDLKVWQEGHSLVLEIYQITREFPREERYALGSQMIARDLAYITVPSFAALMNRANSTHALLYGLIKKSKEFADNDSS
jgi:hypothetical protein